jgi:transposase
MMEMEKKNGAPRPGTAAAIREAARATQEAAEGDRPTRRRFTTAYKERILRELDELRVGSDPGAMAALLRREGLGRSLITRWRRQREAEQSLEPKKRGRRPVHNSLVDENERLRRENERLAARLEKAEVIIDVQKKLSRLLGIQTPDPDSENR